MPLRGAATALWLSWLLALPLPTMGCGGGAVDPGRDAAMGDASPLSDGGEDPDEDGDGFPASQDCDDSDPAIYVGTRSDCASDCDIGTTTCLTNGTWSACTARSDCDCEDPGSTRLIECGNCGQASQECGVDLKWTMPGDCLGQGECSPGAQESSADQCTPYCGTATRLCSNQCTWGPWEGCVNDCLPGEERYEQSGCAEAWERAVEQCTSECVWEVTLPCTADCLLPARTGTPDFKDEICIPGGLAVIGCDGCDAGLSASPRHVVALSPYFIDTYEVTVARYRECVEAGVCQAPGQGSTYYEPGGDALPVITEEHAEMRTYCQWDGGRDLPTNAQWEKAARGPAPSEIFRPWGSDPPTCEHVPSRDFCSVSECPSPVGSHPIGASPYGVQDMGGNLSEFVLEAWFDYESTGTVELDPVGSPSGYPRFVWRGKGCGDSLTEHSFSSVERHNYITFYTGFRCARAGY